MAKSKSGKRKTGGKKKGKAFRFYYQQLTRTGIGIAVLLAVVLAAGITARYVIPGPAHEKKIETKAAPPFEVFPKETPQRKRIASKPEPESKVKSAPALPSRPARPPASAPVRDAKASSQKLALLHPPSEVPVLPPVLPPTRPSTSKLPRVAVIIDDIGNDKGIAEDLMKMKTSWTLSLLPNGRFSHEIADSAKKRGFETMLHLPMEPKEYPAVDPGPGALLTDMSPDELIDQLKRNIDLLPNVKGVNNHMGSEMTANAGQMYQIFSVLKSRQLYFVDSMTTPESVGQSSARLFKLPFEERDVFLDHVEDKDFIRGQIDLLIRIAEKKGESVGIAHPHRITYQILEEMLPEMRKRVEIVPVSQLLNEPG